MNKSSAHIIYFEYTSVMVFFSLKYTLFKHQITQFRMQISKNFSAPPPYMANLKKNLKVGNKSGETNLFSAGGGNYLKTKYTPLIGWMKRYNFINIYEKWSKVNEYTKVRGSILLKIVGHPSAPPPCVTKVKKILFLFQVI